MALSTIKLNCQKSYKSEILKLEKKIVLSFHGIPSDSKKHFVISKIYAKGSDAIHSVSHYTRDLVRKIYNLDSFVIHNGVDTSFFYPIEHYYNKRPKILYVGRFVAWKRPHWVAKLAKIYPNAEFIIHGSPPKSGRDVYPILQKMANKLPNLKLSTKFLGIKSLRKLYQEADIFVFPSRDWLGLVVLEAMACGLPVITDRVGGQAELIEDGKEGFKFSSFKEFEEFVRYLLENENVRNRMGKNARNKALDFDWKKIAKKYEKFYESILT